MKPNILIFMLILAVAAVACVPAPAPPPTSPPRPNETATPTYDLVSTLTSTPTSLPNVALAPTFTTTPAGALLADLSRVDRYQRIYYEYLPVILGDMVNANYPEAIVAWDEVIAALPTYGYAYYQRAESYQQLGRRALDFDEALGAFEAALEDNQRALALNPQSGDLYLQRYQITWRMAWFEPLRELRSAIFEEAAADLTEALRLGNSDAGAKRRAAFLSLDLGRCQEALDRFGVLLAEAPANRRSAEIHEGLARSYLCFGWLEAARAHIDLALTIQNSAQAQLAKIVILINQGDLEAALEMLVAWIEIDPFYNGERYLLRALIYHDLGRYAEAADDLIIGRTQVWDQGGLGAYVEGLLAIQDGDGQAGHELIEYAAASLPYDYGPLLGRMRDELDLEAAESAAPILPAPVAALLTATPVLSGRATPAAPTDDLRTPLATGDTANPTPTGVIAAMPTAAGATDVAPTLTLTVKPTVTPTPSATTALTTTQGVGVTATPARSSLFGLPPSFPVRDLPAPYSGTGPFNLGVQPAGLTLYFAPPERLDIVKIRLLSLTLSPAGESPPPDLYLLFFRYERPEVLHSSTGVLLAWGENRLTPPPGYVDKNGGFFVRLVNQNWEALAIDNLVVRMVVEMGDGRVLEVGED